MRKITLLAIVLMSTIFTIQAQKIGHMNSGNLLAEMPETGRADSVLVIYQKQLAMKGDTLAKAFESEYKAFMGANNAGTLSKAQAQKRQEALQKQQQYLQGYSQDMEQKVGILRKQLLQPILGRLDAAIQNVGKEGKYEFILDTSSGSALFANETFDVTALVKQKLNLK